jgi:hypothetical protein
MPGVWLLDFWGVFLDALNVEAVFPDDLHQSRFDRFLNGSLKRKHGDAIEREFERIKRLTA